MSFRPDETITTERLTLRPPTIDDAGAIFDAYAQDPDVTRHTNWAPHASIEVTREFLGEAIDAWSGNARFVWVVGDKASGELVGGLETRLEAHRAEVGFVFRRSTWGKGFATEATGALIEHVFSRPEMRRMFAYCHVDNAASVRVLEKCGMKRERRVHRGCVFPNLSEEPQDVFLYAITR